MFVNQQNASLAVLWRSIGKKKVWTELNSCQNPKWECLVFLWGRQWRKPASKLIVNTVIAIFYFSSFSSNQTSHWNIISLKYVLNNNCSPYCPLAAIVKNRWQRWGMIIAGERMHSDYNLCCDAAICRWQWGSMGLYGADGVCMCAVCTVILLHSYRLFHHSLSLVVPWPEAPFHHHLHSLTQGAWPSVVFSPDPQMFYSSLSFSPSLSLSLPPPLALLLFGETMIYEL